MILQGGKAGGGSSGGNTIYTGNGTLSGNRTVDLDGNTLTFSGGNVGIGATPTADQLFLVSDGSHNLLGFNTSSFISSISANDGTGFSSLSLSADTDDVVDFSLIANDGVNEIQIYGEVGTQTIEITAANGATLNGDAIAVVSGENYTVNNPSASRTIDVGAATLAETRAVLGTLISDMIAAGYLT